MEPLIFPLAFSTAGGDTASALAAGCPVIIKAHPSHPGTNALVSEVISKAVKDSGLHPGIFSSVQCDIPLAQALVYDERIKAVGFTGSYQAGKALCDLAAQRPTPIPVYAEMGSVNPIFVLRDICGEPSESVCQQLAFSVNLGAGQFCTNPGLIFTQNPSKDFIRMLTRAFSNQNPQTMLNDRIRKAFDEDLDILERNGVTFLYKSGDPGGFSSRPTLAMIKAEKFIANPVLHKEVFGPFSMLIHCLDQSQMETVAKHLEGQLTASIFTRDESSDACRSMVEILEDKAGRIIFNGVPTGVEVSPAMHHGGPFPSTSDSKFTSVGTDAIKRFTRPVCYQNVHPELLPEALKVGNPLGIWRKVNGQLSKE